MKTFFEWLFDLDFQHRLWLIENYFTFDPAQYNRLFDDELAKLSASSPEHREALKKMTGFSWVGYIAKSVRNAGYRDQKEVQERTHDIVVSLLTRGLFRDYDEARHGPIDKRFKRATANAVKNMVALDRNRRRNIPTAPLIGNEAGKMAAPSADEDRLIDDFRKLVGQRLGQLGVALIDAKLQGQETNSLVGREDLGSPGRFVIKRVVADVKALAREFGQRHGDAAFLRDIERAMEREGATIKKRLATGAARRR